MMTSSRRLRYRLLLLIILLLVFFAVRALRYPTTEMDIDEVWTIWQTFGTPQQIIQWTPYDWGPLSYLVLGLWKGLTGIHPDIVRLSTLFLFLPACTAVYRATRRLLDEKAAWLALIAYGAAGYTIYLTTLLHGYALIISLMPFALWFTVRYFDHPTVKRAVLLALVVITMIYTHPTSMIAIAMLALFTVPMYGRKVWLWWLPGVLSVVGGLPEFLARVQLFLSRTTGYVGAVQRGTAAVNSVQATFDGLVHAYTGMGTILWIPAFGLAFVGLGLSLFRGPYRRQAAALGLWLVALIPLHYVDQALGVYDPPKHLWWLTVAVALWIAVGLARFPRILWIVWGAAAIAIAFLPLPGSFYNSTRPPFIANFSFLAEHYQPGDAVLIDPQSKTAPPEAWDYFTQAYFPNGLNVVTSPQGYRRVWYVTRDSQEDPATQQAVMAQRTPGIFVGPWDFLIRLYEAPPDIDGLRFANGFRFHGAEIENSAIKSLSIRRTGETIRVKLWWSVDEPDLHGYSVSIGLLDSDGRLVTQADGEPRSSESNLTPDHWMPNQINTETRTLTLPVWPTNGTYRLYLTVYRPDQNMRIDAPGLNSDKILIIGEIQLKVWSG